jgi:exonuclease VII small subunit
MTITNQYPGFCLTCKARVQRQAGVAVKVDGRWSVFCSAHSPAAAAGGSPAAAVTIANAIEIRMEGARAIIRPASYLGPDMFERYRSACGGADYDRERKANRASLDIVGSIVTRLAREGFALDTDPEVTAAVQAWEARATAETSAASGRAAEVDAKLRERGLALFPFQGEGVAWLAPRPGAVLADDMGLGKTIQALTALPAGVGVLVVAPAVAKRVWERECKRWRPDLTPVVLAGRGSFRWPRAGELVITNYDILPTAPLSAKELKAIREELATLAKRGAATAYSAKRTTGERTLELEESLAAHDRATLLCKACPPGTVVIADEAHGLKGARAKVQRCDNFGALADAAFDVTGRVWLLTATPLLNNPRELWNLLSLIRMQNVVFGSYQRFRQLCGAQSNGWGDTWSSAGIDSNRIGPKLQEAMLRRMKADVLHQLPAKIVEIVDVDLDASTRRNLDKIVAELEALGISLDAAVEGAQRNQSVAFEQMSRARALLAVAKTAAALEMVDELEEAGEPCVVFSAHREPIRVLGAREGWAVITGDTPPAERNAIEERFQRGELKGVAGTIKASGVAITLTRANEAIFIDDEWTPALNVQAEDRIYRIGQARPCRIRHLRAAHKIDQRVFELLGIKSQIIARTTDAAAVKTGALAARTDASTALEAARVSGDMDERRRRQAAFEERVRAERAQDDTSRARRRASVKAEAANRNRGWAIDPATFDTAPRAAVSTAEVWAAVALETLASYDGDHALAQNDVGFNKADTYVGHALAAAATAGLLSDGEWQVAIRLARRYPRQVGQCPSEEAA